MYKKRGIMEGARRAGKWAVLAAGLSLSGGATNGCAPDLSQPYTGLQLCNDARECKVDRRCADEQGIKKAAEKIKHDCYWQDPDEFCKKHPEAFYRFDDEKSIENDKRGVQKCLDYLRHRSERELCNAAVQFTRSRFLVNLYKKNTCRENKSFEEVCLMHVCQRSPHRNYPEPSKEPINLEKVIDEMVNPDGGTEPVSEPKVEPTQEPHTEPKTEPISEPPADISDAGAEPTPEPQTEPPADKVADAGPENTPEEKVTEPTVEKPADTGPQGPICSEGKGPLILIPNHHGVYQESPQKDFTACIDDRTDPKKLDCKNSHNSVNNTAIRVTELTRKYCAKFVSGFKGRLVSIVKDGFQTAMRWIHKKGEGKVDEKTINFQKSLVDGNNNEIAGTKSDITTAIKGDPNKWLIYDYANYNPPVPYTGVHAHNGAMDCKLTQQQKDGTDPKQGGVKAAGCKYEATYEIK